MNSPTGFQEPGCPLPHAVRLYLLGLGSLHTSQRRTGGGSCCIDRGPSRVGPAPGGRQEASPFVGARRRDTPAQEPNRGAAIRVEGSFSQRARPSPGSSAETHLARGEPRGRWAATRGTAEAALRARRSLKTWGHPAGFCKIEAGSRCVSVFATPASLDSNSASKLQAPESICPRGWWGILSCLRGTGD